LKIAAQGRAISLRELDGKVGSTNDDAGGTERHEHAITEEFAEETKEAFKHRVGSNCRHARILARLGARNCLQLDRSKAPML
jgi:hypothetical protein